MSSYAIIPSPADDAASYAVAQMHPWRKTLVLPSIPPEIYLEGNYGNNQIVMDVFLPKMREGLLLWLAALDADEVKNQPDHYVPTSFGSALDYQKEPIQIFLGEELMSLYACYYTHLAGRRFSLTIRDVPFVGGKSLWVRLHLNMLNKLVTTAFENAVEIEINGPEHIPFIQKSFPNLKREYIAIEIPGYESKVPVPLGSVVEKPLEG